MNTIPAQARAKGLVTATLLLTTLALMLACGPAASPSMVSEEAGAGGHAPPPISEGAEPIPVQQTFGGAKATPLPTVCADGIDADGNPETICGITIPEPRDLGNMTSSIYSMVEDAKKKQQANSSRGVRGDTGSGISRPERHRVRIDLMPTTDGSAVIRWLDEHDFAYEDYREDGLIFADGEILLLPELSELEGVFLLSEPIKNIP